jgi:hypothetical protein
MRLKFLYFRNLGSLKDERLILEATSNIDLGLFIILRNGISKNSVTTSVKDVYWFPDLLIKAGEKVVIYTKKGKIKEKVLDSGKKTYFFYWGKDESIWSKQDTALVIMESSDWISILPDEMEVKS